MPSEANQGQQSGGQQQKQNPSGQQPGQQKKPNPFGEQGSGGNEQQQRAPGREQNQTDPTQRHAPGEGHPKEEGEGERKRA
jgi:hypothetical protein